MNTPANYIFSVRNEPRIFAVSIEPSRILTIKPNPQILIESDNRVLAIRYGVLEKAL